MLRRGEVKVAGSGARAAAESRPSRLARFRARLKASPTCRVSGTGSIPAATSVSNRRLGAAARGLRKAAPVVPEADLADHPSPVKVDPVVLEAPLAVAALL